MGEIRRVGVVGSGLMGSGIAEVCARAGLNVLVGEVSESAVQAGKNRVAKSLHRAVQAGKLTAADRETALTAIRFTTDLGELADRELVIEAVTERADAKSSVLATLDEIIADREAILASNTSSIPIMRLAMATRRAGQVIGIHFFNPVPVLSLVELIPSLLTSEETCWRAEAFVTATLGKTAIRGQDRAGFVVNALLIPYLLASIRMLESGFASAQDIDTGMVLGCRHPMGPLRLTDLIGLDTVRAIAGSMHEEFKEPQYAAPPLLLRMVDAGLLGKKTGCGFYDYTEPAPRGVSPDLRAAPLRAWPGARCAARSMKEPTRSIVGMAMTNLLPAVVVPAACSTSWWISDEPACFLTAGACASVFYLAGLAAFIVILHTNRGVRPSNASTEALRQEGRDG